MYTIGQISEMFYLPISTLRYYDKQGLFPGLKRTSGIRKFGDREIEMLRIDFVPYFFSRSRIDYNYIKILKPLNGRLTIKSQV